MTACKKPTLTQEEALRRVRRWPRSRAYRCRTCDGLHLALPGDVAGTLVEFEHRDDGEIMMYVGSKIQDMQ